jgi:flagellar motor switch protein FliN
MSELSNPSTEAVLDQVAAVFADALGYDVTADPTSTWTPPAATQAFLATVDGFVEGTLVAALDPSEVAKHGEDGLAAAFDAFGAALSAVPGLTVVELITGDAPVLAAARSLTEEGAASAVIGWAALDGDQPDPTPDAAPTSGTSPAAAPSASSLDVQANQSADLPGPGSVQPGADVQPGRVPLLGGIGAAANSMRLLHDVRMRVTAELGRAELSVRELLALAPGSVIELDRVAGSPIDVLVNDKLVARGEVVVIDEEFGVRIVEIVIDDEF